MYDTNAKTHTLRAAQEAADGEDVVMTYEVKMRKRHAERALGKHTALHSVHIAQLCDGDIIVRSCEGPTESDALTKLEFAVGCMHIAQNGALDAARKVCR